MKKELMAFGANLAKSAAKKSPTILVGVGIAASVSAVIFAVKASPKAHEIVKEHKEQIEEIEEDFRHKICDEKEARSAKWETRMVTFGKLAKTFGPTMIFETISIASIVFSHRICLRRQMALAALYAGTEAALSDKILEAEALQKMLPSKKKTDEAKTEAVKEKMRQDMPQYPSQIVQTGYGSQLCYDRFAGGWFYGDHETVRQIFGNLEKEYRRDDEISVAAIRRALHLPVQEIHKGISIIRSEKRMEIDPEFRYVKLEDIVDWEKDIWAKNIPPLTPVLVIDYEDAIIEAGGKGEGYNYYGDF